MPDLRRIANNLAKGVRTFQNADRSRESLYAGRYAEQGPAAANPWDIDGWTNFSDFPPCAEKNRGVPFPQRTYQASRTSLNKNEEGLMNRILCCVAQIGVLIAGLVCGSPAFAQEPHFPPETSAAPPEPGPSGSHHETIDPDEQLARMTTRYSLNAEQQDQVKPILVSQQHQIQGLHEDTTLSRKGRMAKIQSVRSDSNVKIKAILNDDQKKQFERDQLRMQKRAQLGQGSGPDAGTQPR
jgi:periplasmic protein CpxP/Spy